MINRQMPCISRYKQSTTPYYYYYYYYYYCSPDLSLSPVAVSRARRPRSVTLTILDLDPSPLTPTLDPDLDLRSCMHCPHYDLCFFLILVVTFKNLRPLGVAWVIVGSLV
jgi:hypothetical protein